MAFQQPTNRGSLFKNTEKFTSTSADYRGEINIDGVMYFLGCWINDGASGKYLRLSAKKKDKQPEEKTHADFDPKFDDEIPF